MQKENKKNERLKNLSDATQDEFEEAIEMASFWLTDWLDGYTERGAFSLANLGEEARIYFVRRAYIILKNPECKWKWREKTKLSTLFINVVRSEMGHVLTKYLKLDGPDVSHADSLPIEALDADEVKTEMEMLEDLKRYESLRDTGHRIARAAAKGNPKLEQYVELVFQLPDYRAISKRMKINMPEVKQLESDLITILTANKTIILKTVQLGSDPNCSFFVPNKLKSTMIKIIRTCLKSSN